MVKREVEYYLEQRLKAPKSFFEWAYSNFKTYVWSNKQKTIKASDRKHNYVVEKRLSKNSRLTFFDKKDFFMIVLSTSKRIEIQTYEIASRFVKGNQQFSSELYNLETIAEDEYVKVCSDYSGKYKFGHNATSGMNYYYPGLPGVYPNNWQENLSKNQYFKFIDLSDMRIQPENLENIFKYRQRIEFAQKINANKLAQNIALHENSINMRTVTKNWLKRNKVFLRDSTRSLQEVKLRDAIEERGGKYVDGIEKYLSIDYIDIVPKQIGIVKMQNYLIKQKCGIRFYKDYMMLLKDLDLPFSKSNLLPKNVLQAHDKLLEILNAKKIEIQNKDIEARKKVLGELEVQIGKYVFVIPKDANDLIHEGDELHHCVGGSNYIESHGSGETTIVFIRKASDPQKSYFTMEYKNKRIIQVHGLYNVEPDEDIKAAVDQWLEIANKKVKKAVAA